MRPLLRLLVVIALLVAGCGGGEKARRPLPAAPETIKLTSPAFRSGATMPRRFTCDGGGASPPLRWSGVPRRARELALVMEDPDAPGGTFVHWTVLRLRPLTDRLPEGAVPAGAIETANSFGDRDYGPPCPPKGDEPHRYVVSLYGLSKRLALAPAASPDEVRAALRGVAIARGRLIGRYGR